MEHRSDSALIQELTTTRAALETAIATGENLQARVDRARELVLDLPVTPSRRALLRALDGAE